MTHESVTGDAVDDDDDDASLSLIDDRGGVAYVVIPIMSTRVSQYALPTFWGGGGGQEGSKTQNSSLLCCITCILLSMLPMVWPEAPGQLAKLLQDDFRTASTLHIPMSVTYRRKMLELELDDHVRLQRWSGFADEVQAGSVAVQALTLAEAKAITKTLIEQSVLRLMQAITTAPFDGLNVAVTSLHSLVSELLGRSLACGDELTHPLSTLETLLGAQTVPQEKLSEALKSFNEGSPEPESKTLTV